MAETQYYKVTTQKDNLVLRSSCEVKPDNSNKIASMPKGTVVSQNYVLVPQTGWIAVNYAGKSGFASAEFLTACGADGSLMVNDNTKNQQVTKPTSKDNVETIIEEESTPTAMWVGIAAFAAGTLAFLFL